MGEKEQKNLNLLIPSLSLVSANHNIYLFSLFANDLGDHCDGYGAEGRPSVLSVLQEGQESTCQIPSEIRDQVYDEKANTVTIIVVCCSPEKIMDKLCRKGGGSIKSIEIPPPPKPKQPPPQPEKPKEPEKKPEKPKEPEKKPDKPKEPEKKPEKPKEPEKKPDKPKEPEKPKQPEKEKPKEPEKPKDPPPPKPAPAPAPKPPEPVAPPTAAPMCFPPVGFCCTDCYHGHGGGPCYYGGPPPQPCYETYGRPVYDSWGGGGYGYRHCYVSRGECFSEENPQGCSIM
ncbi:metal ion binding protein [Corchorus capsularis]|uniref:Metal ion binding protein n=1 Tax=Corchorus capsularis TaxID=210143 RepID=A0A1R3I345_COCAP|nr:metal ion binding protein [Corchorus capsularis]